MSTQTELIEKARRGERITKADSEHVLFDACDKMLAETCCHQWRTVVCNNEHDVDECYKCGTQVVGRCTFDEEYS